MALAMQVTLARISREQDVALALRIGIATGPVLAGVIGARRLTYDVWGDRREPRLAPGGTEPARPRAGLPRRPRPTSSTASPWSCAPPSRSKVTGRPAGGTVLAAL